MMWNGGGRGKEALTVESTLVDFWNILQREMKNNMDDPVSHSY